MPLEQVVPQAEVQSQSAGNLPVVLHESAQFDVPPMTKVGCQLSVRFRSEARIHPGCHSVRTIHREEEGVVEVIRRSSYVKLGVLDISAYLGSDLNVVTAV